jgi:hypothetical protein
LPLFNKADISLAKTEEAHATCEINLIRMSKARQRFRDNNTRQTNKKNTKLTQKTDNIIKIATFSRIGFG